MAPGRASLWREEIMGKITPLFGGKSETRRSAEQSATGLIEEMSAQLVAANDQITASRKEEKRLAQQGELAARAAGEWEMRAMSAVRAGDDVVARDALVRKHQHEVEYDRLRAAEKKQHEVTGKLTRALVTLNYRVEQAKRQRPTVPVRAERAERAERADTPPRLEKAVGAAATETDDDAMMKRLEAKMTDIEAELELSEEAIANLTREAGDALRTQDEQSRMKREGGTSLLASKPLAKTLPSDDEGARPSQAVGVSGPPRTKR